MNRSLQVVLIALALAGAYCSFTTHIVAPNGSTAEKTVMYADGSDPMPACRGRVCPPENN
jgi:hypothetical protein